VISLRLATLQELQMVYSLEDLYNLIEIARVDAYNRWVTRPKPDVSRN
jgi:hypothetical protein